MDSQEVDLGGRKCVLANQTVGAALEKGNGLPPYQSRKLPATSHFLNNAIARVISVSYHTAPKQNRFFA